MFAGRGRREAQAKSEAVRRAGGSAGRRLRAGEEQCRPGRGPGLADGLPAPALKIVMRTLPAPSVMMRTFQASSTETTIQQALPSLSIDTSITGEVAHMVPFYATAAIFLFVSGSALGVLIVICVGIHLEERDRSLTKKAPTSLVRGVRRLTGHYVRGYGHPTAPDRHTREWWLHQTDSTEKNTANVD